LSNLRRDPGDDRGFGAERRDEESEFDSNSIIRRGYDYPARLSATPHDASNRRKKGGEAMSDTRKVRTYERPTLTALGSFKKTGLGISRGPERLLVLRFSL
jgi:hypothetical protein